MSYHISVFVRFDPCALREHDFQPATFGLANLVSLESCARCGTGRYPRFECVSINRETNCWGQA